MLPHKNQWALEAVVKLIKAGLNMDNLSEEVRDGFLKYYSIIEKSEENKAAHIA